MPEQLEKDQAAFWRKVQKTDSCWIWTASLNNHGYGQFRRGRKHGAMAHRFAYEWAKGEIPTDFDIDHLCRNPRCVNPEHLEAVTHRENMLRGDTRPAQNAAKTHCPKGHEYIIQKRGSRSCNVCTKLAMRRLRAESPGFKERQYAATRRWYANKKKAAASA